MHKISTQNHLRNSDSIQKNVAIQIDERLEKGKIRIQRSLKKFLSKARSEEGEPSQDRIDEILPSIEVIARRYYNDCAIDEQLEICSSKPLARSIHSRTSKTIDLIASAPDPLIDLLELVTANQVGKSVEDVSATDIVRTLEVLKASCRHIYKSYQKERARTSILNACESLWHLREELTGAEFLRSWDDGESSASSIRSGEPRRLTSSDGRFVQAVLQAIDPKLEMGRIRTQLKRIARQKPKSGPRAKSRKSPT